MGRGPYEVQAQAIHQVFEQLADVRRAFPLLRLVYMLAMQWSNNREASEARARLRLANRLALAQGIEFVGLCLPGPGKIRTLNGAIALANRMHLKGLMWVDDDVRLHSHCLVRLVDKFVRNRAKGAVGATKIPAIRDNLTSRLLQSVKGITESATNFPHGCCMMVETEALLGGIPDRYSSDDVYVCFRLLNPRAPNPLERLELVRDARCTYSPGGRFLPTLAKVRLILLNQCVFLADWPPETTRYYFKHILFIGLWPLGAWDGARGWLRGIAKLMLQWLYFALFVLAGAELVVRGFLRAPLRRIAWN